MYNFRKKRLFTFGCSMTSYTYPTWADILGFHYSTFENWGKQGQGNNFILSSVIECDKRNNFSDDDDILILWTSIDRLDFYQFTNWGTKHKMYPHNNSSANCPDGYELLSLIYKSACYAYLDFKKINYKSMDWSGKPMNPTLANLFTLENNKTKQVKFSYNKKKVKPTNYNEYIDFLTDLYKKQAGQEWPTLNQILTNTHNIKDTYILKEIEDFKKRVYNDNDWDFDKEIIDSHPLPSQHLKFVETYFPNFKINQACYNWIFEIESQILSGEYKGFKNFKPKDRF